MYTDGIIKVISNNRIVGLGTKTEPFQLKDSSNVEKYDLVINNASFILEIENRMNNKYRSMFIRSFDFNSNELPNNLEISNINEPQYIKEYKKTLKIK